MTKIDLSAGPKYVAMKFSHPDVESMSTVHCIAVGAQYLPEAFRPRFERLIAELAPKYDPQPSAIGRRDTLIREHARRFTSDEHSLTKRAKSIERDLSQAASIAEPKTIRMVSAKVILTVSGGKTLKYRQLMTIIRPI